MYRNKYKFIYPSSLLTVAERRRHETNGTRAQPSEEIFGLTAQERDGRARLYVISIQHE